MEPQKRALENTLIARRAVTVLQRSDVMNERRTQLKKLILHGKAQGYLTLADIRAHLPHDMRDVEQIESIAGMMSEMGIRIYEIAPKPETLLVSEVSSQASNESLRMAANDSLINETPHKDE